MNLDMYMTAGAGILALLLVSAGVVIVNTAEKK